MLTPQEKLSDVLAGHRLSMTAPRRQVFSILQNSEPLSIHELVAACGTNIDRSSVYRTVRTFEQLGVIKRIHVGWKYKLELSDGFQEHHHHLHCLQCGTIYALPEDHRLESRIRALAAEQDFVVSDHQFELRGLCANCRTT